VGDNGRAQQIIKTIRGRGYRFVAAVEVHAPASLEPEAAPQPHPGKGPEGTTAASPLAPEGPAAHEHPPPSGDALFCPTCGLPLHLICSQ
jgi:DNA-binding winged helix-turn-helix (wHTH) protein